ncbi:hypothetical protein Dshi_2825 [Dinoroseobacter shibae DFL 12 = DSM 16493]|jgi:carnitine 3-dehydrogenase|uniref:3-hydroxyacyl-CoA dehydrogenase NAD binding domain-containing protein n=1 Tax=Dinoroseobacter shibae (strain DSM 16493 / NCIMB 14021 / DFL 12) TaxID=398580 RepID=A8LJ63_DINSH|nr:thioesterase family protein [Dinoroseobacter shibae]ABV94558.1 hypothetical protein Dshi_2825 [Dinoroseobacter shibae DFL 12 = DSM 16493]URF45985.1 3-hydroxyacyl-CoA dehydrogenase NAD-binding domain-containing protein [Dinoroseobacter shibae]URF50291.1 3-hydroxyacyl-CoA dehydrogenase NAD-binding domain-containing protein [Dinoroseobacter shibae]
MDRTAAIIGSGRIGSGWAARFLLFGWHVRVFDADPGAQARLTQVIEAARTSLLGLYDTPLPPPGRLSQHGSIAEAVAGAVWVQESVPEDLSLKREVVREVQAHGPEAIVASAASDIPLEALREGAARPERVVIARAVAPVYLLPPVVLEARDAACGAQAEAVLRGIGMTPLQGEQTLGPEGTQIAAALGLAAEQGPATDARRDATLVGVLRALKAEGRGVGAAFAATDRARMPAPGAESAPLLTAARVVPADWADYNGHMTEARYLHAFGNATDRFMELIGVDAAYLASGGSFFTAETHIRHLGEMRIGAAFEIRTTCLAGAGKRMHLWHEMRCDGRLVATGEHMLIHVSLRTRRPAPPAAPVAANLARIAAAHARLARAEGVGRAIGDPR